MARLDFANEPLCIASDMLQQSGSQGIDALSCWTSQQRQNICVCLRWTFGKPNIHNIFTICGHRFGNQSGLGESSGRNATSFLHGSAFRVDSKFSKVGNKVNVDTYGQKRTLVEKACCNKKRLRQVWNAEVGLGIPSHIWNVININKYYIHSNYLYQHTLLVSDRTIVLPLLLSLLGQNSDASQWWPLAVGARPPAHGHGPLCWSACDGASFQPKKRH